MAKQKFTKILPDSSVEEVGRSYVDLVEEWTNWLIMEKPEENNNGNVVFLRGVEFPNDPKYAGYSDIPVMMVGTRSLEIRDDQAIFIPIIASTGDMIDHGLKDEQARRFYVRSNILQGDNPPNEDQLQINGEQVAGLDLKRHLIYSRDYTLRVPEAPYGTSLKDFLDIPFKTTGDRPAITGGYFVLIKFERHDRPKKYTITFYGRGAPWQYGEYMASGMYQITVFPSPRKSFDYPSLVGGPSRLKFHDKLNLSLNRLKDNNEITSEDLENLNKYVDKVKTVLTESINSDYEKDPSELYKGFVDDFLKNPLKKPR